MAVKKFILNADDFGMTKDYNRAVMYAYSRGFLKSASLCANGEAFDNAVNEVLPECPRLGVGVHLNIIEGKALTKCNLLTNDKNEFNNGYLALILKSGNKDFKNQVEKEFRAQIEKVLQYTKPDHIDSHVHTHAIPEIFKITVKLTKEYNIPYIRTQYEEFYNVPELSRHLNFKYPVNILKIILLNFFTAQNKQYLSGKNIKTNDYLLGVGYTGMMDNKTIEYGLSALPDEDCIAEALIHPCKYSSDIKNQHMKEFLITQDRDLETKIYGLGFEITNYKQI
ncbi:ChbG/HpnK family deacetylase [bacterium]|nr:ChbG/HpnK family deacetylase [bacterium]